MVEIVVYWNTHALSKGNRYSVPCYLVRILHQPMNQEFACLIPGQDTSLGVSSLPSKS